MARGAAVVVDLADLDARGDVRGRPRGVRRRRARRDRHLGDQAAGRRRAATRGAPPRRAGWRRRTPCRAVPSILPLHLMRRSGGPGRARRGALRLDRRLARFEPSSVVCPDRLGRGLDRARARGRREGSKRIAEAASRRAFARASSRISAIDGEHVDDHQLRRRGGRAARGGGHAADRHHRSTSGTCGTRRRSTRTSPRTPTGSAASTSPTVASRHAAGPTGCCPATASRTSHGPRCPRPRGVAAVCSTSRSSRTTARSERAYPDSLWRLAPSELATRGRAALESAVARGAKDQRGPCRVEAGRESYPHTEDEHESTTVGSARDDVSRGRRRRRLLRRRRRECGHDGRCGGARHGRADRDRRRDRHDELHVVFNLPALTAAQIEAEKINAEGGVDGRPIVFKTQDTNLDPAKTKAAALRPARRRRGRDLGHVRRRLRHARGAGGDQPRQARDRALHRNRPDGPEALRREGQPRVQLRQRGPGRGLRARADGAGPGLRRPPWW